jgi:bacteriorhodopsin
MIQNNDKVEVYRYFDWFFTTPILLVDLCILLDIEDPYFMFEIVIYNTLMLLFGFLSEINYISMLNGTILGFIPFILIFKRIKDRLGENTTDEQYKLLYTFFSLWSLYGVNHMIKDSTIKNLNYNALDFATKGMFGLYIYAKSW